MKFFENLKKNKCKKIIGELIERGVIRNVTDREYLLLNIDLWIDEYLSDNILMSYVYMLFYNEVKNKNITNKKNIWYINGIMKSKLNTTIFINEDNLILKQ